MQDQLIYTYSREQAIQDGLLIDLSQRDAAKLFTCPLACTVSVWAIIQMALANPNENNDLEGVLFDVLYMAAHSRPAGARDTHLFQVVIRGAGRRSLYTLKAHIGPGDDGEPVLTILLPNED